MLCKSFNENDGVLRIYPGSPALANLILREQDQHYLWELRPSEFQALQSNISSRSTAYCQDGFVQVASKLDNKRHCFVLIDPPYKDANEYSRAIATVKQILHHNSSATVMVWMPMCKDAAQLNHCLPEVASNWVRASLTVSTHCLIGSTIHVVNPPAGLHAMLQSTMPWLAKQISHNCCDYSVTSS
jgi:23S rRNA (adenine2030-N6)-methyltransferase